MAINDHIAGEVFLLLDMAGRVTCMVELTSVYSAAGEHVAQHKLLSIGILLITKINFYRLCHVDHGIFKGVIDYIVGHIV